MTDTDQLTEAQAQEILTLAKQWLGATDEWAADEIKLYPPGFHSSGWTLALEGGPDDWPWHLSQDEKMTWPKGVFLEPVSGWCLGLYPA